MTETEHPDLFRVMCHHVRLLKRKRDHPLLTLPEPREVYSRRVSIERRRIAGHRKIFDLDETMSDHGLNRLDMHRLVCGATECGYDLPLPMAYLDALVSACIGELNAASVFVPPPRSTEEQARRNRRGANVGRVIYPEDTTGGTVVEIEISVIPC